MEKEKDGVWRTIRGRRIFIGKGESLGEAMSKSGKFNRSDIRETKEGLSQADRFDDTNKKSLKDRQKAINKMRSKSVKYSNSVYTTDRKDEKNRINENAPINKDAKTRVERNKERYSETDRRELRREELQKRLDAEKLYNKNRELYHKHGGFYNKENNEETNNAWKEWLSNREKARKLQDNANNEDTRKLIREYQAKKQSNNKIESDFYKKLNKDDKKKYDDYIKKGYSQSDIENTLMYKTQDERMREAGIEFASSELNKQSNSDYPRAQGATKFEDLGLQVSDKKAFSDYLQDKYGTDDFRIINFDSKEGAKQIYNDYASKREYDKVSQYFKDEENHAFNNKDYSYGFSKETLQKMETDDLQKYVKKQEELYNKYKNAHAQSKMSDQRKKANKQDVVWNSGLETKYKHQYENALNEVARREETIKHFTDKKKSNNKINTNIVDYDKMEDYDVYNEGMKFLEDKNRPTNAHYEVDKIMRRIDNANKRGEGFSNKATNDLRKYLKENGNLVKSKEEIKKERELYKSIFGKYPPKK